jgi:hypothetical protein
LLTLKFFSTLESFYNLFHNHDCIFDTTYTRLFQTFDCQLQCQCWWTKIWPAVSHTSLHWVCQKKTLNKFCFYFLVLVISGHTEVNQLTCKYFFSELNTCHSSIKFIETDKLFIKMFNDILILHEVFSSSLTFCQFNDLHTYFCWDVWNKGNLCWTGMLLVWKVFYTHKSKFAVFFCN